MQQEFGGKVPSNLRRCFIHVSAVLIGDVRIGNRVHIAPFASLRADEGSPIIIADNVNIQDHVTLHGLANKFKHVEELDLEASIYIGPDTSVAHNAVVHGPTYLGAKVFVGFSSVIHNSVIGEGCYIGNMALVEGVTISPGRYVPRMAKIVKQAVADKLKPVQEEKRVFTLHVVEVNHALRRQYRDKK